jgi:hypothetical protein
MFKRIFTGAASVAGLAAVALAIGAGTLTATTTSAFADSPTPTPSVTTSAADEHWPLAIQGKPTTLDAGSTRGWYFWHDADGLHIRTTTSSDRDHVFTAVLTTSGRFVDIDKVRLEGADDVKLGPDGHRLVVKFHTHDGIDGVDFRIVGGDRLTLNFDEGHGPIGVDHIFIGHDSVHPLSDPFTIRRDD